MPMKRYQKMELQSNFKTMAEKSDKLEQIRDYIAKENTSNKYPTPKRKKGVFGGELFSSVSGYTMKVYMTIWNDCIIITKSNDSTVLTQILIYKTDFLPGGDIVEAAKIYNSIAWTDTKEKVENLEVKDYLKDWSTKFEDPYGKNQKFQVQIENDITGRPYTKEIWGESLTDVQNDLMPYLKDAETANVKAIKS